MEKEKMAAAGGANSDTKESSDGNDSKPRVKKARGDSDGDAAGMRISLHAGVAAKIRTAIQDLKARGATVTAEDLLSDYWVRMPDDYVEEQVTKMTPEEYYLEAARKIPELRDKLIQQAKRALALSMGGVHPKKSGRRRKIVTEPSEHEVAT